MADATYIIHTQELILGNNVLGLGYAGNGDCLNDPTKTPVKGHGPLPVGLYFVGAPEDRPQSVGEFALPLTPYATNLMFGRGSFLIHGDNKECNHTASDGCIVLARPVREAVAAVAALMSGFTLEVVA